MNATVEIDKAGRLVVPKKFRDVLQLVPGTRVTLHQQGDSLVLHAETKPRGLHMKRGTLVYDSGSASPTDVVDWITEARESRMKNILEDLSQP